MADSTRNRNCVNKADFYIQIEQLKRKLKTEDSRITFYFNDDLYIKANTSLKDKMKKQLGPSGNKDQFESTEKLTSWEHQTAIRHLHLKQFMASNHTESYYNEGWKLLLK